MKATALRLYGASDLRLEPVALAPAGEDAVLVEIVTNSICMSDWKAATLGTRHKRVPKDVATNPVMIGHEVCGVVREVGARWRDRYREGQRVSVQPAFNLPGRELETMGYAWPTMGGETTAIRHVMGPEPGGTMLLLAGCGAMGLAAVDIACHWPEARPRRLVVTDVDEARLARAAAVFGLPAPADGLSSGVVNGVEVRFRNTRGLADPVAALKALNVDAATRRDDPTATGGGYDDVLLFAAVPALIEQSSALMGFGGCLNFFAGPTDQNLAAPFNFYNVHYMGHHCVGSSGGDVKDMADSLDWISRGILHPEVMVTHVGGLDSAAEATLSLHAVPGGKRLVYTHLSLPMTPIADFARLGETDPLFADLARICEANRGLWCAEAEQCLLARAPKMEF